MHEGAGGTEPGHRGPRRTEHPSPRPNEGTGGRGEMSLMDRRIADPRPRDSEGPYFGPNPEI